jgi:hypothetical protein
MKEKKCPKCKQIKSADEFFKSHTRVDKLATYCKVCEKISKYKKTDKYSELYGIF